MHEYYCHLFPTDTFTFTSLMIKYIKPSVFNTKLCLSSA